MFADGRQNGYSVAFKDAMADNSATGIYTTRCIRKATSIIVPYPHYLMLRNECCVGAALSCLLCLMSVLIIIFIVMFLV